MNVIIRADCRAELHDLCFIHINLNVQTDCILLGDNPEMQTRY